MTLRIGLLGASRIAPRAIIAPAQARQDATIAVVAARELSRAQAYAAEHGIPEAVQGYEALAARDDIDLIYCALPPTGHLEPCLAALEAGKALLVEKPFAMNRREAETIAMAAAQAGRPAMEAFHYRFHSMFRRALDLVREGAIGEIKRAEGLFEAQIPQGPGALRWNAALGGGGAMDLGCYVLHALRTLIGGEPEVVEARAELVEGVDASLDARLLFPGAVEATLRCSMRGERRDFVVLHGERGQLRLERFASPQAGGRLSLTTAAGVVEEEASGPSSYAAQLAHVVEVMAGRAEALTGGADAVANMAVLDTLRQAVGMQIGSAG
jgi:predicted dehydrogenase